MLANNLSNKSAPVLAFNFERIICEKFGKKRFQYYYAINKQHVSAINKLYWKEFSIFYITFEYPGKKLDKLEIELEDAGCMFNGTLRVNDVGSLLFWFRQREGWYYDSNKNIVDSLYPFGQIWSDSFAQIWQQ